MSDVPPNATSIRVHADRCDDATIAAIALALQPLRSATPASPTTPSWLHAAFVEARSDLRVVQPQQLQIRGNKRW